MRRSRVARRTVAASKFTTPAFSRAGGATLVLGYLGSLAGVVQMLVGLGTIVLSIAVSRQMSRLQHNLDHNPAQKARLYYAFNRVDPTRRGSIHVGQLAALADALSLDAKATDEVISTLQAPSGLIHLDEFSSWCARAPVRPVRVGVANHAGGRSRHRRLEGRGMAVAADSLPLALPAPCPTPLSALLPCMSVCALLALGWCRARRYAERVLVDKAALPLPPPTKLPTPLLPGELSTSALTNVTTPMRPFVDTPRTRERAAAASKPRVRIAPNDDDGYGESQQVESDARGDAIDDDAIESETEGGDADAPAGGQPPEEADAERVAWQQKLAAGAADSAPEGVSA